MKIKDKCEVCSKDYEVVETCKDCGRKMCIACKNKKKGNEKFCNDCRIQE
jgi:membrane protease subunit (stomatin/prohibitin family)